MKLFYRIFYKGFLRHQKATIKPKEGLVYAFTDVDAKNYYTWPDKGELPMIRFERLMDLLQFWEAKIAPQTLEELADAIIVAGEHAVTGDTLKARSKALSNVIVFANELKLRKEQGIPSIIFHEISALFSIREDENAAIIDQDIHEQKLAALLRETSHGRDFFLRLPHLQQQLSLWVQSKSELRKLLSLSELKDREQSEIIRHLSSGLQSKPEERTAEV
jgi:hypothetical protein